MEQEDPFEKLFVDEKTSTEQLNAKIEAASKIFSIERETGKIIFKDFEALSDSQRVLVVLLARYIAKKHGMNVSDTLGPTEIGAQISKPRTSISFPANKLKSMGLIESVNGASRVNIHRIDSIVDYITTKRSND